MEKARVGLINGILKKEDFVLAAYLFGSQAKGAAHKDSDVDIAVLFAQQLKPEEYTDKQIAIMNNISQALNREADVVVLNSASLFLKYHILKEGVKIYERPGRDERSFEAKAITEYFDFLPIKNRIENALLNKIKEA